MGIHAFIGKVGSLLLPGLGKSGEFYLIRVALALACAACEARLFAAVAKVLNPRVGVLFVMIVLASPGMFHAAAAYLPSSFSMYLNMLGMAALLDWKGGSKIHVGIMWFGIGGIVGWPFAAALIAPLLVEEILLASITRDGIELARRILDGTVRCMIVVVRTTYSPRSG